MSNDFFKFLEGNNIKLNDKQREAIIQKDGPVLVLASPGSGKTTVLNARIAYLIHKKVDPRNILALTFSKAAAKDMDQRFQNTYQEFIHGAVRFSTIHSFAYRIVRHFFHRNNISYDLIEGRKVQYDKKSILKRIYYNINKSYINEDKLEELSNTMGFVKNMMISPEELKSNNLQIKGFDKIFKAYEEYKKNNEYKKVLLDFDDMLIEAYRILNENKNILRSCQNQYRYVLMDEGQDTSLIQNKIIELIVKPHNNLFIVCDDDQSIFKFRGAEPKYLLEFKDRFQEAKTIFMEQNYRSTKNIVEVANKFIKGNNERYPKEMFTDNEKKNPIKIVRIKDNHEQLQYLINELKGTKKLSDVAVLFRNNISAIVLADKLSNSDIPFYIKDYHKNFFSHWVLNDMLNFIRFSFDTNNINLLEAIYTKFKSYISKAEIEYLKNNNHEISVFQALINNPDVHEFKKKNLKRFEEMFKELQKQNPEQAIKYIRKNLEYEEKLEEYCDIAGYSFENLRGILNILEEISRGTFTFYEFVDKLNNLKRNMHESRANSSNNSVTLSTLHSSKGLEFERVFMIDLIDGQLPSTESVKLAERGDMTLIEEERRLWYVGMTRAKSKLELLVMHYNGDDSITPSRFIREVENTMLIENQIKSVEKQEHIKVESIIRHNKFGLGLVKNILKDIITIDFDDRGEKDLSLSLCIKNKLIKSVEYKG